MMRYVILLLGILVATISLGDDDDEGEHEGRSWFGSREAKNRRSLAVATDPTWKAECGSCHLAFPPGLLPERSWRRMMAGLDDHFGENASLESKERDAITKFLATNAADHADSKRSRRIASSIPASAAPLRITETAWFKRQHHEVGKRVWERKSVGSRANCAACHRGAESGNFSESGVSIPR